MIWGENVLNSFSVIYTCLPFTVNPLIYCIVWVGKWCSLSKSIVALSQRPPIPDNCPFYLKDLVRQCWQHDPKVRFDIRVLEFPSLCPNMILCQFLVQERPKSSDIISVLQRGNAGKCPFHNQFNSFMQELYHNYEGCIRFKARWPEGAKRTRAERFKLDTPRVGVL